MYMEGEFCLVAQYGKQGLATCRIGQMTKPSMPNDQIGYVWLVTKFVGAHPYFVTLHFHGLPPSHPLVPILMEEAKSSKMTHSFFGNLARPSFHCIQRDQEFGCVRG